MVSIFRFIILSFLIILTSRFAHGSHIFEIESIDDLNPDGLSATLLIKFTDTSFYPRMCIPYIKDASSDLNPSLTCLDALHLPKQFWTLNFITKIISSCYSTILMHTSKSKSDSISAIFSPIEEASSKFPTTIQDPLSAIEKILNDPPHKMYDKGEVTQIVTSNNVINVTLYNVEKPINKFYLKKENKHKKWGANLVNGEWPYWRSCVVGGKVENVQMQYVKKHLVCDCYVFDGGVNTKIADNDNILDLVNSCIASIDPLDHPFLSHMSREEVQNMMVEAVKEKYVTAKEFDFDDFFEDDKDEL